LKTASSDRGSRFTPTHRRGHPLKRTPNGTLTENSLSQSSLASRLSQELFSQIGRVQKSGLNFDQNGRSKGTAEVVFAERRDAVQAIKTYNGVKLDGRPLQIELVGGAASGGLTLSSGVTITPAGGRRTVSFNAAAGGGGGGRKVVAKVVARSGAKKGGAKANAAGAKGAAGKGKGKAKPRAKKTKETPMTAEELDAQLDSYKGAAAAADDAPAAMEA